MDKAEARISSSPRELAAAIDRFISDNRCARTVEDRWLAQHMTETLTMLGEFISKRGLGPELRAKVNAFRATEIENSITEKRRELEKLDRELQAVASG